MAGSGTGQPIFFRCAVCRKTSTIHSARRGMRYETTGRVRGLTGGQRRQPSQGRIANVSYEYRCLDCGHTGWSRHKDVERKFMRDVQTQVGAIK
jgi:hypothetical protein